MAQYVFTMNRVGKIVPPKRQILKDITLSFFPGAKIGVLGVNGSGKSTFLKIMAGVDKDIEGEAVPMPGIKIGYLPQEPVMNPDQTVREAVEEGIGGVLAAKKRLDEVYALYAEPDADFDALVAEQAKKSERTEVKNLAQAILKDEPAAIAELYAWKKAWYGDERSVRDPQVPKLGAYDKTFDLRFLNAVIAHHENGVAMTQDVRIKSNRSEVLDNADAVEAFLKGGIKMLSTWRSEWYNL